MLFVKSKMAAVFISFFSANADFFYMYSFINLSKKNLHLLVNVKTKQDVGGGHLRFWFPQVIFLGTVIFYRSIACRISNILVLMQLSDWKGQIGISIHDLRRMKVKGKKSDKQDEKSNFELI